MVHSAAIYFVDLVLAPDVIQQRDEFTGAPLQSVVLIAADPSDQPANKRILGQLACCITEDVWSIAA
jgi:hypothetical protein